jgi:hypothetical protein
MPLKLEQRGNTIMCASSAIRIDGRNEFGAKKAIWRNLSGRNVVKPAIFVVLSNY